MRSNRQRDGPPYRSPAMHHQRRAHLVARDRHKRPAVATGRRHRSAVRPAWLPQAHARQWCARRAMGRRLRSVLRKCSILPPRDRSPGSSACSRTGEWVAVQGLRVLPAQPFRQPAWRPSPLRHRHRVRGAAAHIHTRRSRRISIAAPRAAPTRARRWRGRKSRLRRGRSCFLLLKTSRQRHRGMSGRSGSSLTAYGKSRAEPVPPWCNPFKSAWRWSRRAPRYPMRPRHRNAPWPDCRDRSRR